MTPTDAATDAHLREILASDEFKPPVDTRFWQGLTDAFKWAFHALTGLGALASLVIALTAGALLLALGIRAWRLFGRSLAPAGPSRRLTDGHVQGPASASLADKAKALATMGQWRDAALALHQALLVRLCARSGIEWREAVSDWEWLARLPPSPPLIEFTRMAERLAFGQRPDAVQFASCVRLYDELVGERR